MKILAIADQTPNAPISQLIDKTAPDLVCTLGDLNKFQLEALKQFSDLPKVGVYGNHHSSDYFDELGITNLHMDTVEINGVIFGGFEGGLRYKRTTKGKMYTQKQSINLLKNFPSVDVMISHSPPYGINDEPSDPAHEGFRGLLNYLKRADPDYFLHGHTYPDEEELTTNFEDTQIIYVFKEQIINCDFSEG